MLSLDERLELSAAGHEDAATRYKPDKPVFDKNADYYYRLGLARGLRDAARKVRASQPRVAGN